MKRIILVLAMLAVSVTVYAAQVLQPQPANQRPVIQGAANQLPAGKLQGGMQPAAMNLRDVIHDVKLLSGLKRQELLGKTTTFHGYYSNVSVPMIVDDIERLSVREILPPDSYVLLAGSTAAAIRHGDRVELKGVLTRPTNQEPAHLQNEQIILKLDNAVIPKLLRQQTAAHIVSAAAAPIVDQASFKTAMVKFKDAYKHFPHFQPAQHYAVLVNGGWDPANNRMSFWNDIRIQYDILIARGYAPANIYVLNADGRPQGPGVPVNYSAIPSAMTTVFQQLSTKMGPNDSLYVFITDHGTRVSNPSSPEADRLDSAICLWGHNTLSQTQFKNMVNTIANYSKMTFVFDLCYSGGFSRAVAGPRRVILTASDRDKVAYDSRFGPYGALNLVYSGALSKVNPVNGQAVNADANGDGKISFGEAFNYSRATHGANQRPHYEDTGSYPDTFMPLPQGTEGTYGLNSFL